MVEYLPYTYLLGWSNHDTWYYGCEYSLTSKVANPQNLWTIYFTSSGYVKRFREEFGEPDIIEIRKTFKDDDSTRLWEAKVLKRMKVINDSRWLNQHDGCAISRLACASGEWSPARREKFAASKRGKSSPALGHKDSAKTLEKKRISHLGKKIHNGTFPAKDLTTGKFVWASREEFNTDSNLVGIRTGTKNRTKQTPDPLGLQTKLNISDNS